MKISRSFSGSSRLNMKSTDISISDLVVWLNFSSHNNLANVSHQSIIMDYLIITLKEKFISDVKLLDALATSTQPLAMVEMLQLVKLVSTNYNMYRKEGTAYLVCGSPSNIQFALTKVVLYAKLALQTIEGIILENTYARIQFARQSLIQLCEQSEK